MQFGSGVLGGEPPVDGGLCRIALDLIGVDGSLQGSLVGITPLETGPGQHAELNLRHVQPTGVFGCVVKFQPPGDAGIASIPCIAW